jgi:predicted 3-demethylubiquinone-9 3-methyltransferase (glyoxalase superfamily)
MAEKIIPFLMFYGRAEEAVTYYVSLFEDSRILSMEHYGEGEEGGTPGSVRRASFALNGQTFMAIDSSAELHGFGFTPALSLYVDCRSEEEIDRLFAGLAAKELMPLGDYGFSRKFGWTEDKFGVSWQLNLAW